MKLIHIVGARPNFMKVAPVRAALATYPEVTQLVLHTGQHYDVNMSDVFFQQLGIGMPDINLQVGSGSHAAQTAEIMTRLEPVLLQQKPDWVLVYGDVNSTVAATLVCSKLGIHVAHVEAGLRSFDRSMPEEINRLVTDQLADLLFTPSVDGNENLAREGVGHGKIHFVGNVMVDTLLRMLPAAPPAPLPGIPDRYALVTLHRPANVDDHRWLKEMFASLSELASALAVVFPVHPRTRTRLAEIGVNGDDCGQLILLDPQPYLSFLSLQRDATLVITDSGGIQEETTCLGIPCITVRENTERPITITEGTNRLAGRKIANIQHAVKEILAGQNKSGRVPPFWDGKAGERIARILVSGNSGANT